MLDMKVKLQVLKILESFLSSKAHMEPINFAMFPAWFSSLSFNQIGDNWGEFLALICDLRNSKLVIENCEEQEVETVEGCN